MENISRRGMMIICMYRVDIWKKNRRKRGGRGLKVENTRFTIFVKSIEQQTYITL